MNVSVGSKIQAIASMMACMMFKDMATIEPYYVVPEKYNTTLLEEKRNQETEGMKDIITLPEYKIEIPDKEERSDQAAYMALNKNLIEPLMDWKFISVEKMGSRHIVSLTDEGINALRFLHESK